MKIGNLVVFGGAVVSAALILPFLFHKPASAAGSVPRFEVDPYWPKQLPNNWMLGGVGGILVDSHDNIWVANPGQESASQ